MSSIKHQPLTKHLVFIFNFSCLFIYLLWRYGVTYDCLCRRVYLGHCYIENTPSLYKLNSEILYTLMTNDNIHVKRGLNVFSMRCPRVILGCEKGNPSSFVGVHSWCVLKRGCLLQQANPGIAAVQIVMITFVIF